MKSKLEKQLRSFIDFDYSKRTIDRFHRWMISPDSAEEKEMALHNLWFKTKGKFGHGMEHSFQQVLDKIGIEYTPMVTKLKKSPIPPRARATWTASSRVETATTATPGL